MGFKVCLDYFKETYSFKVCLVTRERDLGQASESAPLSIGIHLYFSFASSTLIQTLDILSIMYLRGFVQDFTSSMYLSLKSIICDRH